MTIGEFISKCETQFYVIVIVDKDNGHGGICYKAMNDIPKEYYYREIYSFNMKSYDTLLGKDYVLEITV